jgi:putative transposase
MGTTMLTGHKKLEVENALLDKMYVEGRLKADILNETLTKKF